MYKAKHLPLLALALLVSSTELRADEFPFKNGDMIKIDAGTGGAIMEFKLMNIKGKWIEVECPNGELMWVNSDRLFSVFKSVPPK